jgi:NADPH-dependent ferric siderophore reductase
VASIQALFRDTLAQLVFKEFSVDEVRDVSAHFRRFRVSSESLRSSGCAAGDKVQIMIGEAGPRTFTPFSPDPAAGTFDFLAYVHGDAPAAAWARSAHSGLSFRAFGPRGSLPLSSLIGPVVMFGDETSFGAAKSLLDTRGAADGLSFVFESTDPDEAKLVLADIGLSGSAVVKRQAEQAHLAEIEAQLTAAGAQTADATLVLTGHAQMIQAIRARLKARPVSFRGQKVKAYWADGKKGLD